MESNVTWFYIATIAFCLGIFFRSFYQIGMPMIIWFCLIGFVVVVIRRRWNEVPSAPLLLFSLIIFCFSLGALRLEVASWNEVNPVLDSKVDTEVTLEGVIKQEPDIRTNSIHLYVETEYGLILVKTEVGGDWSYGDYVIASGKISKPDSFETDLGREFDYAGYLLAKGVSYTVGFAKVEKISEGNGFFLIEKLLDLKGHFMASLEKVLPEPQVGLGEGLLLGVKRALGEDLENSFRKTGIIHIVVLSGYNVMIVVAFILYILNSVLGKTKSVWFGIVGIILFAILVGLGATVVRASLMACLLLIMSLTGRTYLVLRGLCVAGLAMLLWNPYLLVFDVGFQLSFLATMGLIFISPILIEKFSLVPQFIGVREFLTATIATQIFVLPILLYQIGELSVVSVVVNVLVLPMVPIAMLLTFITGIISLFSPYFALPVAYLANLSLSYIIFLAEWFGNLPFAAFVVPAFSFYFVPFGYLLIFIFWYFINYSPEYLKDWIIEEEK